MNSKNLLYIFLVFGLSAWFYFPTQEKPLLSVNYTANDISPPEEDLLIASEQGQFPDIKLLNDSVLKLKNLFENFQEAIPQEKVYLHLDKPFYKPGETIWGSVYVLNAFTHQKSTVSDIVYVDLINPQGRVEQNLILKLNEGRAKMDFPLSDDQVGGLFKIKAYTQWLKNSGEEAFFEKDIFIQKVVNPKLLLKLDFERKGYGAGEQVIANLEAKDLSENKIAFQGISFTVQLNGKKYLTDVVKTDVEGKATIKFSLPKDLNTLDGLLNIIVPFEGKSESISRSIPIVLNKIDLQFMPEGGDLLAGVACKIAFKALNEYAKPTDISGVILDEKGAEIQHFESFHDGMGVFSFIPQAGKKYTAKITKPQNISKTYPLPLASKNTYAISIDKVTKKKIALHFYVPDLAPVYVLAQQKGSLILGKYIQTRKGLNKLDVPIENLQAGIVQITLLDQHKQGRAERLVFVHPDKTLNISLKTDKKSYRPREKVDLSIQVTDHQGQPVQTDLSLAVVNEQILNIADDKQDNILSYLLMSSDLKGKVEEPSFYFDPKEEKAKQALDLVMMTHGWRRFNWQEVLQEKYYVKYTPEKIGIISGYLADYKTGKGVPGKIYLFEVTGKKRSVSIDTDAQGKFSFTNIEPGISLQLFAKRDQRKKQKLKIILDEYTRKTYKQNIYTWAVYGNYNNTNSFEQMTMSKTVEVANAAPISLNASEKTITQSVTMQADASELSEVVVVGYGTQEVRNLTGSISVIRRRGNVLNSLDQTLGNALSGKSAGIVVTQPENNERTPNIQLRGISSFLRTGGPLYVVDGLPLVDQTGIDAIDAEEINSIVVLKGAEAMAIYGSEGANGVVEISTKSILPNNYYSNKIKPSKYTQLFLGAKNARSFSETSTFEAPTYKGYYKKRLNAPENDREFYQPRIKGNSPDQNLRNDFRNTLYWNPSIQTDKNGQATLSFYTSDDLTTFKIIAEGLDQSGQIGRTENSLITQKPVFLEAQLPAYLTMEDTLYIPVYLKNNTDQIIRGKVKIYTPSAIKMLQEDEIEVNIEPKGFKNLYIACTATAPVEGEEISVIFKSDQWQDAIEQEIEIQPKGFPTEVSFSGNQQTQDFKFNIPVYIPGSLKTRFVAYPTVLQSLMEGVKGMFRQPSGCFEQVSSKTFPNVLALQLLQEAQMNEPEIEATALKYIKKGYHKLAAYETKEGGFEWFGNTPPHEGLTAYGLLEFIEMKKVYPDVSQQLIHRTKLWLMERRDGKGGFKSNTGKYGFAGALSSVTNAYLVFALSQAGVKDIEKEYTKAYQEALKSEDMYRMALMTLSAYNLNHTEEAKALQKKMYKKVKKYSLRSLPTQGSIVRSYGMSLQIESASWLGLAELRNSQPDFTLLQDIAAYLLSQRRRGKFGSTQGTILALQFLTAYVKRVRSESGKGMLKLLANGQEVFQKPYDSKSVSLIEEKGWEHRINAGKQLFQVQFDESTQPVPYAVELSWSSYTPDSSPECQVDLETRLSASQTKLNETVRLSTMLMNKKSEGLPMAVALVGIPSGLNLQPWQLKEIKEKGLVDFYEVRENYVVFYFTELAPNAKHVINLDLQAKVPGVYQAPAASAYLYYTDEYKDWEAGEKVVILQ